jgi:hypothetical protein
MALILSGWMPKESGRSRSRILRRDPLRVYHSRALFLGAFETPSSAGSKANNTHHCLK